MTSTLQHHFTKGILLAGGSGSRLLPVTRAVSKHLLPVFDKPMVYYPLSVLMQSGIRQVLIITNPSDTEAYRRLLGDGSQLGMQFSYAQQPQPRGIAEAFLIGRAFVGDMHVALILGDNVFSGDGLRHHLQQAASRDQGATVFACSVSDPERFGVVEFDGRGMAQRLVEKPAQAGRAMAVTGLYFYDNQVLEFARQLQPSSRGELDITDLNQRYLAAGQLHVEKLEEPIAWWDAGTDTSLLAAANHVAARQAAQQQRIACIEELAFQLGYIDAGQFANLARSMGGRYGEYLLSRI